MTMPAWLRVAARAAVGLGVAGAIAVVWIVASPTTYTASASVYVGSGSSDATVTQARGYYDLNRAQSYVAVVRGSRVLAEAARRSGTGTSAEDLARHLSVQVLPQTVVIRLTVEDERPVVAQALSNAVAEVMVEEVNRLEQESSQGASPVRLSIVDPAEVPRSPAAPDRRRVVVLSLLIGALVALVVPLPERRAGRRHRPATVTPADLIQLVSGGPGAGSAPPAGAAGGRAPRPAGSTATRRRGRRGSRRP